MENEYEEFRKHIVHLQSYLGMFKVDFLDRESFKVFADNLYSNVPDCSQICITGYFSESSREELEHLLKLQGRKVRLICQELNINDRRDKRNLEVLRKLQEAGAEIKVNNRLHARILVAFSSNEPIRGLLILGSFDFNAECMGKERYDAGIKTQHPDLVRAAKVFFERIWNEPESAFLDKHYPKNKS